MKQRVTREAKSTNYTEKKKRGSIKTQEQKQKRERMAERNKINKNNA